MEFQKWRQGKTLFLSQGDRILSGSDDRSVKLWTLQPTSPGSAERPLVTLTGHSGPVVGVLLCMPFALSAAGCTVRLWDVLKCGGSGVCLKLLHHDVRWLRFEDVNINLKFYYGFCENLYVYSPVTTMTWTSTFRGAVTIDAEGQMRCFDLVSSSDSVSFSLWKFWKLRIRYLGWSRGKSPRNTFSNRYHCHNWIWSFWCKSREPE